MALRCIAFVALVAVARGLYLPGVAPVDYFKGDLVELKVNKLTSVETQLPYEYYSLPFCHPTELKDATENLGEVLRGDRIQNSDYIIKMQEDSPCSVLCKQTLSEPQGAEFKERIQEGYHVHWIMDNLPAATHYYLEMDDGTETELYEDGFALGFMGDPDSLVGTEKDVAYIYNHVAITILYHQDESFDGARIVGFEVTPYSIKHVWALEDSQPQTCNDLRGHPPQRAEAGDLVFTYSVKFQQSAVKWASRWDIYLQMTDSQIHWFSIINSLIIVLFLSAMIGMIVMRTLHQDMARYNQIDLQDEVQEESGWKLVHGDVLRPPAYPMVLSIFVGSGVQVLLSALITLVFALLGFLSPANRGGLLTAMLVLFVFMGVFGGYSSSRVYKTLQGKSWKKNTIWTAVMFPGVCFSIFFILNLFIWGEKSSGAVPFGVLVGLMAMWFGVSVPLTFLGAYFGYKKKVPENPVRTNQIPRQIPPQAWYMQSIPSILMGGVLPFGAVFIELFFILSSIWLHQFYYIFGFLFLVVVILLLTCAEITIVMCYFQLCGEDYHWWWRAFLTSACSAVYMFLYSVFYFFTKLHIKWFVSALLFFGYTFILSFAFFCMTGAVGFYSCHWFVRKIYGAIKVA